MAAGDTSSSSSSSISLYSKYTISSAWELTLQDGEVVKGKVYGADPGAGSVVLQDANEIRMVSLASIREAKRTQEATKTPEPTATEITHTKKALEEREKRAIKLAQESIRHLNPKVRKHQTHERMDELVHGIASSLLLLLIFSFKASVKGQMIFDRLLKACNEVVWKGESIVVLQSIQVDPPYGQDTCKILKAGSAQGSLDRVQKIVASVTTSD